MFKTTIVRYGITAAIAATAAFGTITATIGQSRYTYHDHYLVFNRLQLPEESGLVYNCTSTVVFNDRITALLNSPENAEVHDMPFCVVKVGLTDQGEESLPEQLGDLGLVGVYDAEDAKGDTIPFTVYMPMVMQSIPQDTK